MGTILTPNIAPSPVRSKIVFPSQPPQVPAPTLSSVAGGALAAQSLYVKLTWVVQTQDGTTYESLPSNEVEMNVAANNLLVVNSPASVLMPFALVGYNVYVATASGAETLQNSSPIAIGTNWTEPVLGLMPGVPPPSSWGSTLIFTYPAREVPYFNQDWKGHDEFSTAGWQQSITWYIDNLLEFKVDYIADGDDAAAWRQFLSVAIKRVPFDFYLDSTQAQYMTVYLTLTNPKLVYKAPGLYSTNITARQAILTQ